MIKVSVILNAHSGTLKASDLEALERRLATTLVAPRYEVFSINRTDRPIDEELSTAVAEDSDCILIGGGDGSVSAAAAAAWKSGKMLAVLPGGTMNLYARTLDMPLDVDASIDSLATAEPGEMDIATANGVPFIHQYTVGLHANAVRLRQNANYDSRFGKLLATARAFGSVILNPPTFPVEISGDGISTRHRRLSALSISNNLFGRGHIPYADRPDGGTLGLYCSDPLSPLSAARLMVDIMLGTAETNDDVQIDSADRIALDFSGRRKPRKALLDGELIDVEQHVEIIMHAGTLKVLIPKASGV